MGTNLFILILLLFASMLPLTMHEVVVYQVVFIHNNEVDTYNYTFVINSIQNSFVNFTLIITDENNGSIILNNTYIYPEDNLRVLPVNGVVFNGENFTFIGFSEFKGENASVYKGYFIINDIKIPSTAYFINGTLHYLNGSINGYSVTVSLDSMYKMVSTASYSSYLVLGIIVAMLVIGVIALIKIGKI